MLLNALCLLIGPQTDVRVLEESSLFGIKQSCTITRTVDAEGGVTWEEKTVEDKNVYWVHTFQYGPQGGFLRQEDETVSWDKVSHFKVTIERQKVVARMLKYLGNESDSSLTYLGDAGNFSDVSKLWWSTIKPELGAKAKSMTYIQMLGFYDVTTEYTKDETISVGDRNYEVHRLERKIDTVRNETWWVDDKGLVVKRAFWSRNPDDPYRVDTIKG